MRAQRGADARGVVDSAFLWDGRTDDGVFSVAHAGVGVLLFRCGGPSALALLFLATRLPGEFALLKERSILMAGHPALDDNLEL